MSGPFTRRGMAGNGTAPRGSYNGMAIASLVCGIIGLFFLGFIFGPLALILGGVALYQASRGMGRRGLAWAGLILGVIDVVLLIVVLVSARPYAFSWHAGG
jgi:uncharacterized protein DUF4190